MAHPRRWERTRTCQGTRRTDTKHQEYAVNTAGRSPIRIPETARMCTPSPGLVGDFLRDGPLAREVRPPDPLQLCADLIESPIQIQCSRGYLVATHAVGKAGLPFLVGSRIEEDS